MHPELEGPSIDSARVGDAPATVDVAAPAILLVDDQPARLLTYEAVLSGMPIHCVRAHSGEEALQLLLKRPFALILLDVNMPGMDGFEVARHVRSHSRLGNTPIIFVTGERFGDLDRLKGYEVGAIDYIGIPIIPEILRSKVAVLVELYSRRAALEQLNAAAAEALRVRNGAPGSGGAADTHLRALFEQTTDMVLILRGERDAASGRTAWRYVDANTNALRIYDLAREAVVGHTVDDVFPERAQRVSGLCEKALLGEPQQYETTFKSRELLVRLFAVNADCVASTCTDITDRKRIQNALANSERRFQALLEGCPVGVAQNNLDGRFEYANAGFCRMVGFSAEELSRMTWRQITHPADISADEARAELVLAGQLPHYTLEKRYIRKDGTPIWVSMFGNFIFDEQRRPVQGVAVIVDITARREADFALHESRQRLILAHEAAGLGSFDWNIRTDIATWDSRARELWGVSGGLPLNRAAALDGIHPEDQAKVCAALDSALDPRSDGRFFCQYRVIHAVDRATRWVESHGQAFFEDGVAVRMVGTMRDISKRVAADHRLRESEERFRELANNIDQVVWTCDASGQPTWYNDRWYEFAGGTFQDMRDERWRPLVHPEHAERIVERFRQCVAAGETWEETFPIRGKNGEYRWFLSRAIPIKAPDGTVLRWFGSNTDITAQREMQEALTRADRRKDEFLAMLAHELRNPVAPIMNVARALSEMWRDDQKSSALIAIVDRQVRHLGRLLDDLLDVARVTRDRITLHRESIDINECVKLARETVEAQLRAGNHPFEVVASPLPLLVNGDKVRLTQCITNFLDNAAKYSEPGTPISIRTIERDGHAVIEVRDAGRGISAEFLPHVFDLFAQGPQPLDRESGGLGVGLSVCKRLVEMHGGKVSAHSEGLGRGSTFSLSLPLAEKSGADRRTLDPKMTRTLRILIVDDNQDAADTMAMLLQMSGHETSVAYDGADALRTWSAFRPDVIMLDIGLPGMDGYEVMRRLKAAGYAGYTIALSGYGQPEDKVKTAKAGFNAHLVKPVDLEAVERALVGAG